MFKIADQKASADVEYLSSAIVRDALIGKFQDLFGQDPVSRDINDPLHVVDARVPNMIQNSVDSEIAGLLTSSAIENVRNVEGVLPDVDGSTLLYTMMDGDPADISLDAVEEYQTSDPASRDSTVSSVAEDLDINVEDGVAYVSGDISSIMIGIYVKNEDFASEFQYKLENAGGDNLSPDDKVAVFDDLFNRLPGGDEQVDDSVRADLMKVVGLTKDLPKEQQQVVPEKKAPGPEPITAPTASPTASLTASIKTASEEGITLGEAIYSLMSEGLKGWNAIAKALKEQFGLSEQYLSSAENEYLKMISYAASERTSDSNGDPLTKGAVVISSRQGNKTFLVKAIVGDDIVLLGSITGTLKLANKDDLIIY